MFVTLCMDYCIHAQTQVEEFVLVVLGIYGLTGEV